MQYHMEVEDELNKVYWDSKPIYVYEQANVSRYDLNRQGSPCSPLEFPSPRKIGRAIQTSSNVLDPISMEVISTCTIIFRSQNSDESPNRAYYIMDKIGDTTYGSVRICRILEKHKEISQSNAKYYWKATNKIAAVKISYWSIIQRNRGMHLSDPLKEVAAIQLMSDFQDTNVQCIDSMSDNQCLYLFMPYYNDDCLYGNMMTVIRQNAQDSLTESQARKWFRQLLLGIHHLQERGICHRKLSLENLMVHNGKLKIIDFSNSLRIPYSDPMNENCITDVSEGTIRKLIKCQGQGGNHSWRYIAPEIVQKQPFDGFAIDLWSAAIILYVMLLGAFPFQSARRVDSLYHKFAVEGMLEGTMNQYNISISKEACDLLQNMLWENPMKRLTLLQVMEHPWVSSENTTKEEINKPAHHRSSSKFKWYRALKIYHQ